MILCAGLGTACRVARERLQDNVRDMAGMRDRLQDLLFSELDNLVLNGHPDERLPNTLNISVPHMEGGMILEGLPTIMASTGAACHDKNVTLSHVLSAMGVPPEIGMGALRLTVGRSNTMDQIEEAAGLIIQRIRDLRDGL
jgi:cysteine desulfurase